MKDERPKTCGECDHRVTNYTAFACHHPDAAGPTRIVNIRPPRWCPLRTKPGSSPAKEEP